MTLTSEQSSNKEEYESLSTEEVIKRIRTAMGEGCIHPSHVYDLVDEALDRLAKYEAIVQGSKPWKAIPTKINKSTSVQALNLSTRAQNVLYNAHITKIGELLKIRRIDLVRYRNAGIKTIDEIMTEVARIKDSFRGA